MVLYRGAIWTYSILLEAKDPGVKKGPIQQDSFFPHPKHDILGLSMRETSYYGISKPTVYQSIHSV